MRLVRNENLQTLMKIWKILFFPFIVCLNFGKFRHIAVSVLKKKALSQNSQDPFETLQNDNMSLMYN